MKFKYTCLLAILSGLFACDNSLDDEKREPSVNEVRPLCIQAQSLVPTKDQVIGTTLPSGSVLGIFLKASDKSNYEGTAHDNVSYTADGSGESQKWNVDVAHPINLTTTTGVAYAYFPYQSVEAYSDFTAIPITNDKTDWMYNDAPVTNLSNLNNTAPFNLVHACTIIRCSVHLGTYVGAGVVNSVKVECDGLATGASIDLTVPGVKNHTGAGDALVVNDVGTMSSTDLVVDIWAIPTNTSANLKFTIDVDGNLYVATKTGFQAAAGAVYPFELTINAVEAVVEVSGIEPWLFTDEGEVFPAPTN